MISLFVKKQNKEEQLNQSVYSILQKFYNSFFSNIYNERNIGKYRPIRDAIGLVMRKFEAGDNPLAYTSKLVMYIQARSALNHLRFTKEQQRWMRELTEKTKRVNLSYVYTGPLDDVSQFIQY